MATGLAGFFQPESTTPKPTRKGNEGYEELAVIGELLSEICEMKVHKSKDDEGKPSANGSSESASRERLQLLRRQKASLFQKLEKILDEEPETEDSSLDSAKSSVAEKAGLYEELCQAKLRVKELEESQLSFRRKLTEKVRELETENVGLKSQELQIQSRESALNTQAELLREQKEMLNEEAHALRRFGENVGDDTTALNKQMADLTSEIVEARDEVASLGKLLQEKTEEARLLQAQVGEISGKAEVALASFKSEKAEYESRQGDLCEKIKEELEQARSLAAEMEAEKKAAEDRAVALQKTISSQQMQIEDLSKRVSSLDAVVKVKDELEVSAAESEVRQTALSRELKVFEDRLEETESTILALREQQDKFEEAVQHLADEKVKTSKLKELIEGKEKEITVLSQEVKELQAHGESKEKLVAELRSSGEAINAKLQALQKVHVSEAGSLKTQINNLTADLKSTVVKGKQELSAKEEEITTLRSELSAHEERLAALESELDSGRRELSATVSAAKTEAIKKEEEFGQMKIKLKRALEQVASLENSLNSSEDKEMLRKRDKQIAALTLKLENSNGVLKSESSALEEAFSNKLKLERNRSKHLEKDLKHMEAELTKTEQRHNSLIEKLKEANEDFVKNLKLAHDKEKEKLQLLAASNPKESTLKRRKDQDLTAWCKKRDGGFAQIGEISHSIRELEKLLMSSKLLPEEFLHKAGALYHEAVDTKTKPSTGFFARRRVFVLTACALLLVVICFVLFYSG